ncbi:hypothetical protein BDZ85DRAFT_239732 [Elsinoe ampelina]|uniref:Uncharacterized protein n=1 Tax=Elsinoe ampelina TaxID=302913 RepID=A0A6A6G701_9PEZI|nr:hypothetical protein BDZ85DRAFT_239732 [Elsinoe ampelina]
MARAPGKPQEPQPPSGASSSKNRENEIRQDNNERRASFNLSLGLLVGVFSLFLILHVLGIYLFLSGFLLTRLVLDDKSECGIPPIALSDDYVAGSIDNGCWHPKTFEKAVVVIVDALRYDFTVPFKASPGHPSPQQYHNALTVFHELASTQPEHAVLLPFIADPPTATMQRLKGLTTGTLPTFIDAGSNFAGTAIDEDNIVSQLKNASKTVVHLGDDTWHSLFPGHFDPELTKPYDSFNVWDLFTVDNGVTEHIFPLLEKANASRWDVILGHYLGVDHAGHRYGPDHPAMNSKLKEMNDVFTRMIDAIDDRTLLIVMGDHGMDSKGDHGGESDDEIEAAIWLYSKKRAFGRSSEAKSVPSTAKERPIRQIDLVPTLSLLLGLPIPFNNLGRPIEEAFIESSNADYANLAKVNRLTAAQIRRYQEKYTTARKIEPSTLSRVDGMWAHGLKAWKATQEVKFPPLAVWRTAYEVFSDYQKENLQVCRDLWARFDNVSIIHGIQVLAVSFIALLVFARGLDGERTAAAAPLLIRGSIGGIGGGILGFLAHTVLGFSLINTVVDFTAMGSLAGIATVFYSFRDKIRLVNHTVWGWLCSITVLLLCAGFAANSFTIWEDDILLFFLVTFGILMGLASLKRTDPMDRFLGITQSIMFVVFTRASSFSRLCREEQMPYCKSTYYASATSSTSSWWQLLIPFVVSALLPSAIRDFFIRSQNYHGSAIIWIGIALRIGLTLTALYWLLDSADDNGWFPSLLPSTLKSTRVLIAQIVLALSYAAGYSTYVWASPFISVEERAAPAAPSPQTTTSAPVDPSDPTSEIFTSLAPTPAAPRPQILIYGYSNTHGTRTFLLATIWILPILLLTKPMGHLPLSLLLLSILSLLETLDALDLRSSPLGPVLLALLGNFHFFKTGHSATLSSIQWESAFIPLTAVRYPWSPLLVTLNFFAPVVLCAVAVPAVKTWKIPPRTKGGEILDGVARDLATFLAVYSAVALATAVEASWLRRHLMLFRIFMPRMLLAVGGLGVAGVFGTVVGLVGVRWAVGSVGEVFGWG